jgi:hypothetical protein
MYQKLFCQWQDACGRQLQNSKKKPVPRGGPMTAEHLPKDYPSLNSDVEGNPVANFSGDHR